LRVDTAALDAKEKEFATALEKQVNASEPPHKQCGQSYG
jgi:hypothetical protein